MKASKLIVPLVALVFLSATTAAFLGVRKLAFVAGFQLFPAILANAWIVLAAIAAVTLLFGRFFCRAMCPLGILQSVANWLFHPKTAVRRVCTRLPETAAQRTVRWIVFAAAVLCIAFGYGAGGEARQPLGLSVTGGLLVSQAITLYITPVIFLYFERLRNLFKRENKVEKV